MLSAKYMLLLCYLLIARVLLTESKCEKVSSFRKSVMEVPGSVVELKLKAIEKRFIFALI